MVTLFAVGSIYDRPLLFTIPFYFWDAEDVPKNKRI